MGRASANMKLVSGGTRERFGLPPADRDKNVVPWKEMERRVAERIAAKAARGSGRSDIPPWKQPASASADTYPYDSHETEERPPDSGVRASEPQLSVGNEARPLTFTVYSVEELDARQRFSAPPPSVPPPPPSRWPDVWRSTKSLMRAWWGWYKTPKPRSRVMDVCGVPVATLKADLFAALRQLPWRKILVRGGIGVGVLLFLMFIVLTAAELTDDLKPSGPRQTSTSKIEVQNAMEAPKAADATQAPAAEAPAIELEDTISAAPVTAERSPAKKPVVPAKKPPVAKKKKKGPDVFNP